MSHGPFNVLDFGARGDGVADDTVVAQHNRVVLATAPDGLFGHAAGPCNMMVDTVDFDGGCGQTLS